ALRREGIRPRTHPVSAADDRHRPQLPRGHRLSRPARARTRRRVDRAQAGRFNRARHDTPRAPRREPQRAPVGHASGGDRRVPVRCAHWRRAPRRGKGQGQGAHLFAPRRLWPMAAESAAARAVDAVQHAPGTRRALSRVPDLELDRARHLAVHRARADCAAADLLHAPPRGGRAPRPLGAGDAAHAAARGRAGCDAGCALSYRGRHHLHLPGGEPGRFRGRGGDRDAGRRRERARRHAHGRQDLGRLDGETQEGRVFLMNTTTLIADQEDYTRATGQNDHESALKFITCGSVDDGKSTLIGRLLVDSRAVLQDHLAGVQRSGETDLALLTDGLSAEREQGITIDVAYRYFATERRKFIIGDAPGHEQYTRNMVTAASSADAAVVLVDATKLDWRQPALELLVQTRRHSLLVNLLRVPSIVFAVNKLDAVDDPALAFSHINAALR